MLVGQVLLLEPQHKVYVKITCMETGNTYMLYIIKTAILGQKMPVLGALSEFQSLSTVERKDETKTAQLIILIMLQRQHIVSADYMREQLFVGLLGIIQLLWLFIHIDIKVALGRIGHTPECVNKCYQ